MVHPGQGRLQDPASLMTLEESALGLQESVKTATGLSAAALGVQEAADQMVEAVVLEVKISFMFRVMVLDKF